MEKEIIKKAPLGIKIISISIIITSVISLLFGLISLIFFLFSEKELYSMGLMALIGLLIGPVLIFSGIIWLVLGIFLLKLKNWARITIIALLLISVLSILLNIFTLNFVFNLIKDNFGIFLIFIILKIIAITIIFYLLLNKKVKETFSNT